MTFQYKGSSGLQLEEEIGQLADIVRERKVECILEIGFWNGGTCRYWNDLVKGGYIISMDIKKPEDALLNSILAECKARDNLFSFALFDSKSPAAVKSISYVLSDMKAEVVKDINGEDTVQKVPIRGTCRKVDMLFIGGDHFGAAPLIDWANYSGLVKEGGMIVFDDLNWPDVRHAYEKASRFGKGRKEIISKNNPKPEWNGLGIIYM